METKQQNNITIESLLLSIQATTANLDKFIAEQAKREAKRDAEREKERVERKELEAKRDAEQAKREAEQVKREAKRDAERKREAERKELEAKREAEQAKREAKRDAERAKWDAAMQSINQRFGEFTNSYGEEIEVLFYRSLDKTRKIGHIQFDRLLPNVKPMQESHEYDIILVNGEYVAIVEIKRSAKLKDLTKLIEVHAKTFRTEMPEYKDKKLICVIACIRHEKNLIPEARKQGVCVLLKNGVHVKEDYKFLKEF